ncbi:MAG: hypothetical protein IJM21_10855 [Clostridia bacterium]|nr:hypothetical protein [Clostridia bacterium]
MSQRFLAGWGETDLAPAKRVRLAGQFAERISDSVETPVQAVSLALESENGAVVFCGCDLESVSLNLLALVRERLSALVPDLDPRCVILSATHSHTSLQYTGKNVEGRGSLSVLQNYLPDDVRYESAVSEDEDVMSDDEALYWLADRISESVAEAWRNRAAASVSNQFGRAAVGMCRRAVYNDGTARMWGDTGTSNFVSLEGGSDSGVELLYVFDGEGKLTGVAANLACPAQTVQHRTFLSSDFWGKTRILVREALGENVKVLGLCSPAGDQCPVDLIRWVEPESDVHDPNIERNDPPKRKADPSMFDVAGSWKAGRRVAREIVDAFGDALRERAVPEIFRHEVLDVILPIRFVTIAERDDAEEQIRKYVERSRGRAFTYEDNAKMHVYAGILARYELQQTSLQFPAEIHVLRLGDTAFATSPFELFLDYANWIRAQSPAEQTFLIQLANGSLGYLPTAKAEAGGHYSANIASGIAGHEGGDLLVRRTLTEIRRQFGKLC